MKLQFTTTNDAKRYVLERLFIVLRDFNISDVITSSTSLKNLDEKYGLDSLDEIELLMMIEEELDIEINDDQAESCKTVDDLVNLCVSKLKVANPDPVVDVVVAPKAPQSPTLPYNNEIGILLLPSLENHGRVIQIKSVSVSEALELVDQFTTKVRASRKTKEYKTFSGDVSNMQIFSNIIDSTQMYDTYVQNQKYLDADLSSLFESKVPKTRGLRPVFVSQTVIGVGTTVVYNPNWATVNFEDDTVLGILQKIQAKYQKTDEEDEDSSYYNSNDSSW